VGCTRPVFWGPRTQQGQSNGVWHRVQQWIILLVLLLKDTSWNIEFWRGPWEGGVVHRESQVMLLHAEQVRCYETFQTNKRAWLPCLGDILSLRDAIVNSTCWHCAIASLVNQDWIAYDDVHSSLFMAMQKNELHVFVPDMLGMRLHFMCKLGYFTYILLFNCSPYMQFIA